MKCTECGHDFVPECIEEEICPTCQTEDVPEARMEIFAPRVFTHCNVCGCKLRTDEEDKMGMCERCAKE